MSLVSLDVKEPASLAILHEPHVLVGVDKNFLGGEIDAILLEPPFWLAVEALALKSIDAIAHTRMNPKIASCILLDFINGIVRDGTLVDILIEEVLESETIISVKSRLGSEPDIAIVVFQDGIHLAVAQSISLVR